VSTPASQRRAGLWIAAVAAILFSAKAIIAKLMYGHGVDAVTLIALRMLMAGPIFAVIALIETRRARRRGDYLSRADIARIVVLGLLGYYLSSFLDFWGLQYVSASLERLILFLNPTLVLLIGVLFLHQRVSRAQLFALALSYLGIVLVFVENLSSEGSQVAKGSLLVFLAALSYALYLLLSGELVARVGSLRLVAYAMCVSTLACLIQFFALRAPATLLQPAPVLWLSALNALFATVLPVYLTMVAISRVGAAATSQMAVIGPVSLVFFGWWILDEKITPLQLLGTSIVLCGVMVLARANKRQLRDELAGD